MINCGNCGSQQHQGTVFCTGCGFDLRTNTGQMQQPQPGWGAPGGYYPHERKSKLTAGLLGIFLGGIGVHRFYLGYAGIGIAQIAVTLVTFGIGAWWGVIEGILILTGSNSFRTCARGIPLAD